MRTEDLILVSVDDHVIEPRGMFDGLLPAKYQDKAPQLIRRPDARRGFPPGQALAASSAWGAGAHRPRRGRMMSSMSP